MVTRDTYTKVHEEWKNRPDKSTAVFATDLEHIEQGIKDAADKRALKEIYDDSGINNGLSNTISSVTGYIVNGNGNTLENGSDIFVNGDGNNIGGSANSVSGMGNTVTGGSANSVSGTSNTATNGNGSSVFGYQNKVNGAQYSYIGGSENKIFEEGSKYAVFMHGAKNECLGSSAGAVFGAGNILKGNAQFVTGQYSAKDESKVFIVGWGSSDIYRKNIYTLDHEGNAVFAGNVQGTCNGKTMSLYGIQMEMESRYNSLNSGLSSLGSRLDGIVQAKVFDTKAELDEWIAVEGNTETLKTGQNIYIVETGTPDYWWDGTDMQVLETDKVVIESMTYDETLEVLNETAEGVE